MEEKVLIEPLWERGSISNMGANLKEDNPATISKGSKPVPAAISNWAAEKFALAEKREITI